jgi:hypothetical protein
MNMTVRHSAPLTFTLLFITLVASLSGTHVAVAGVALPNLPERLVPGKVVTRSIWKGDILFFFKGKAGETITLHVTSKTQGLDPYVALLDPDKQEEAFDDDSDGQGNSLIKKHMLKKSGRYIVSVGSMDSEEGRVKVLLEKAKVRARRQ